MSIFEDKKSGKNRLVEFLDEEKPIQFINENKEGSEGESSQSLGSKVQKKGLTGDRGVPTLFYDLVEGRAKRFLAGQGFLILRTRNGYIIVNSAADHDFVEVNNVNDEGKLLSELAKSYGNGVVNKIKKFAKDEYKSVMRRARKEGEVYLGRLSREELRKTGFEALWALWGAEDDWWKGVDFVDVYLTYDDGEYALKYVFNGNPKDVHIKREERDLERDQFIKTLENVLKVLEEQKRK